MLSDTNTKDILMTQFKLMGLNNIVAFSHSGQSLAVAGYDGTVKILHASTGKTVFRHRIPGFKNAVIIHHHQWSKDDRLYAFSCCSKVFVIDVSNQGIQNGMAAYGADGLQFRQPHCDRRR
jgi:WD40 repeat protein